MTKKKGFKPDLSFWTTVLGLAATVSAGAYKIGKVEEHFVVQDAKIQGFESKLDIIITLLKEK